MNPLNKLTGSSTDAQFAFKTQKSFEDRSVEASRIRDKYPDRIPIIVAVKNGDTLPALDKVKYLVPSDLTVGQFVYVIRKRLSLPPEKAIFIMINDTLPPTSQFIQQIYDNNKDADGFLYVLVTGENTFG